MKLIKYKIILWILEIIIFIRCIVIVSFRLYPKRKLYRRSLRYRFIINLYEQLDSLSDRKMINRLLKETIKLFTDAKVKKTMKK